MSDPEKMRLLFEAAMMESESEAPSRKVELPRNPNGARSVPADAAVAGVGGETYDRRREMLARLSRLKETLAD